MYKEVRGKSNEVKNTFFEKAYMIWFDYCPMYRSIDMDAEEYEWRKRQQHTVTRYYWSLVLDILMTDILCSTYATHSSGQIFPESKRWLVNYGGTTSVVASISTIGLKNEVKMYFVNVPS